MLKQPFLRSVVVLLSLIPTLQSRTTDGVATTKRVATATSRDIKGPVCTGAYMPKLVAKASEHKIEAKKVKYIAVPDDVDKHCIFFIKHQVKYDIARSICNATGAGDIALVTMRLLKCVTKTTGYKMFIRTVHANPDALGKEFTTKYNKATCGRARRKRSDGQQAGTPNHEVMVFKMVREGGDEGRKVESLAKLSDRPDESHYILCEVSLPVKSTVTSPGLKIESVASNAVPQSDATKAPSNKVTPHELRDKTVDEHKTEGPGIANGVIYFLLAVVGLLVLLLIVVVVVLAKRRREPAVVVEAAKKEDSASSSAAAVAPAIVITEPSPSSQSVQFAATPTPGPTPRMPQASPGAVSNKTDRSDMFYTARSKISRPMAMQHTSDKRAPREDDTMRGIPTVPDLEMVDGRPVITDRSEDPSSVTPSS